MRPLRRIAFIPLIMLVLAILACGMPPITGITCLYEQNGNIIAPEDGRTWISRDGGFTWESEPSAATETSGKSAVGLACGYPTTAATITDPANPLIQYSFVSAWSIERSEDGGATWRREIDLRGTDARVKYYQATRAEIYDYYAGPLDAIYHSQTGNLIVAMGHEGVLIRTTDGVWHWQGVGQWYRVNMLNPFVLAVLLSPQLIVGLLLALLIMLTVRVLAEGWNVLGVIGAIIGSYFGYFLSYHTTVFLTLLYEDAASFMIPMCGVGIPILVSWIIAKTVIKPRHFKAFILASVAWTFFISGIILLRMIGGMSGINWLVVTAGALLIYVFVAWLLSLGEVQLVRWRIWLGLACCAAFILPFVWWGIGGIAHESAALWWSLGFAALMIAASITVIKRLVPQEVAAKWAENPSLRDVPAALG